MLVRQAVKVGGIQGLALTKLDVLDGLDELQICTGYDLAASVLRHLPAAPARRRRSSRSTRRIEGWREYERRSAVLGDLPAQAIKYVRRIEELVEAPVTLLTTGPERDDTIMVRDPFEA